MANFSSFSSSSSSSPSHISLVDQILAEAMDHIVLEQVASINCSSFTESVLPPHIENRFRKLKNFPSYPSSRPQLAPDESSDSVSGHTLSSEDKGSSAHMEDKKENSPTGQSKVSSFGKISEDLEGKKVNSPSGQSKVSNFGKNSDVLEGKMGNSPFGESKVSSFKRRSGGEKGKNVNSPGGYDSSPSDSSSEGINSPSLNVGKKHGEEGKMGNSKYRSDSEEENGGGGCLCFSPKRVSRKKKNGGGGGGELGFGWGKDEELLSDLRSFSTKEQKRRMKVAMKEEEKIVKEAEKIVKWAKQVSARMDFDITDNDDDVDDVLSNDHSRHRFGGR